MKQFQRFALTVLVALVGIVSAKAEDIRISLPNADGVTIYYYLTDGYWLNGVYQSGNFAFVTHDNNYVDVDPDPTNTNMQLQGRHYSGNIVIPSSIVYNEITYQVVGVDDNAFYKCTELESVVLPNSVTNIRSYAFQGCSSLTSIILPESVMSIEGHAFYGCSSLTSITLPESVTSIESGAFSGCSSLTSITLPESLTNIKSSTFWGCSSLTNITLPESLTSIGSEAFRDCNSLASITLPKSLTRIESGAFWYCSSLEEIELPEGLQYIAGYLFYYCSSLKKVNIPSSIISFRSNAFSDCNSLNSITIPENSSISFENYAFYGYNGFVYNLSDMEIESYSHVFTDKADLDGYVFGKKDKQWYFTEYIGESTDLVLPDNVNGEAYEFYSKNKLNKNLTSIHLVSCIKSIPKSYFEDFKNLSVINLENIETIGSSAFNGCTGLTELTLGKNLTSIGVGAFAGCYNLLTLNYNVVNFENQTADNYVNYTDENGYVHSTYYPLEFKSISTLNIGNEVELIPNNAFQNNKNLMTVEFPNSVKTIGNCAFSGCTGLTELTLEKNLTSIGIGAFAGCCNLRTLNYNVVHFENQYVNNFYNYWYYDENGSFHYIHYPLEFKSITTLVLGDDVEYIPSNVFSGNNELLEVTIGKNLQTAGERVFYGCNNIKTLNYNAIHFEDNSVNGSKSLEFQSISTLNIGDGVECLPNSFVDNIYLTSVVLPNSIKTINDYTFSGCTGIKEINLESIKTIGKSAFSDCTGLKEINLESIEAIGNSAFSGCTGLKEINLENVETIGSAAFNGCTGLSELTLEKNLSSIGVGAFVGCYNLQTLNYNIIHFENQMTGNSVGYYDENGAYRSTYYPLEFKSISTLNIGDEVEYIPNNMVRENKNLTTVNLADGIKAQTIGESTFYGCSNLQSINLYEEPKEIVTEEEEDSSGEETNNEENGEEENEETKEVQMTKGVCIKNIGEYAFYGCPNLNSSLDLRGVETIGNYAFNSSQISNLTLGKNLSSVADNAFSFNAPLEKLTVSNDYELNYMLGKEYYDRTDYRYKRVIKKLVLAEDFADEQITGDFTNQNNLETIESNTVEPLAFALANPFTESQYSSIAVKVPEESAEKYKAAPVWKLFYVTSADCLLKLYNGSSEMQLIPQDGTERPEEASAVNAVMLIDEQLESGNGLLTIGNVIYRNKQNNWVAGEINLSDAKPFYNPVDAVAQTINYVRNFTSTNLQALYLPYAMSYDDWKDKAKVSYINDVHQFDDDDDGEIDRTVLEFISVKSGELAPNIPYLIKPLEKGETTFTSSNKTLKATLYDGYIDCSSTRMLYTLKGTYQTRDDIYANGYYAMSGGTFKAADNAGVTLSPFRVFLSITNRYGSGAVPRAKKITIMVDGVEEETTDIDEIMMSDAQPTEIYNLQGVRVDEGYKGIVIKNGRKVLMK